MKKIAIFLEGLTERIFIEKLLFELVSNNKLIIKSVEAFGKDCPRFINILVSDSSTHQTKYEVLLFNSCNDRRVLSDLIERYENLKNEGYSSIIAIRDLYPDYTYLQKLEAYEDALFFIQNLENTTLIYATMEIETWFIAELNHYLKIDTRLTNRLIKNNLIDLESIENFEMEIEEPAKMLNEIYGLVDKHWSKSERGIKRTVDALDYENLYCDVKNNIASLGQLIDKLDDFLSE